MRIIRNVHEMVEACEHSARPLGLVPTMGALHDGHLALVRRARYENTTLAVSIFVNPTQFGPEEDLEQYPGDPERDLDLLRREGADLVFIPSPADVYPSGFSTWVDVGDLAQRLEGASRPGHFRGVATAPPGVPALNPSFDVTPSRYITAIVTEEAVCRPPYPESLRESLKLAVGASGTEIGSG